MKIFIFQKLVMKFWRSLEHTDAFVPWDAVNTGFSVTVDLKNSRVFLNRYCKRFRRDEKFKFPCLSLVSISVFIQLQSLRTHTFTLTARARDVNLGEKGAVLKLTVTYSSVKKAKVK